MGRARVHTGAGRVRRQTTPTRGLATGSQEGPAVSPGQHSLLSASASAAPVQFQPDKKHLHVASSHWLQSAGAPSRWTRFEKWRGNESGYFKTRGALDQAKTAKTSVETLGFIQQAELESLKWSQSHKTRKQNPTREKAMSVLRQHLRVAKREQVSQIDRRRIQTLTEKRVASSGFHSGNLSVKGMTPLASGQMGSTHNAQYTHSVKADGSLKPWVFKPDTPLPEHALERTPGARHLINMKRGEHEGTNLTLANRSVASSVLDRAMNINALVETHLATSRNAHGQLEHGQVMAKAPGQTPVHDGTWHRAKAGKSWHREETGGRKGGTHMFNDIDYSDPRIQRSMMDLQASDFVTNAGNDRHAQNYLFDKKAGTVKGIDNDLSMGLHSTKFATHYAHLPPILHADTAENILNTDFEEHRHSLKGLVSRQEIEAAGTRLKTMQDHIRSLQAKDVALVKQGQKPRHIVRSFGAQTFKDLLGHEGYKNEGDYGMRKNYVQKHHAQQQNELSKSRVTHQKHSKKMAQTRRLLELGVGRHLRGRR